MCFALGFYEALLGLLNPVEFHLEAFEFMMIVLCEHSSMLSYFTDHASSPCLPSPPPFSLTISIEKKAAGTSHKKVFRMKTSACRDGTLKNQPNKMGTTPHNTFTPSLHLVPFCQLCTTKNSLHTH